MSISLEAAGATLATERGAAPRPQALRIERLGTVAYAAGLERMLDLQRCRAHGGDDTLLLMEPSAAITLGSASGADALRLPAYALTRLGLPVHRVDRGGGATYHGPGQILAYPILRLAPAERDLHRLLRGIEQAIIDVLRPLGVPAERSAGRTGVWVRERKIASIGLSCRNWVTGHGLALSWRGDLAPFGLIVPCGLAGVRVTSIERELGSAPPRAALERRLAAALGRHLSRELRR